LTNFHRKFLRRSKSRLKVAGCHYSASSVIWVITLVTFWNFTCSLGG
jgi:hypothetical protein